MSGRSVRAGRARLRAGLAILAASAIAVGCGGDDQASRERAIPPPAEPPRAATAESAQPTTSPRASREQRRSGRRDGALLSSADAQSFDRLEQQLGGQLGLVVGPLGTAGPRESLGDLRSGAAWSTIKLPIALRVLEDAGSPDAVSRTDSERIRRALTASDNAAIAGLWDELAQAHGGAAGAADAVGDVLREGGDQDTRVSTQGRGGFSPYGQTVWSLAAQQRFMASLAGGCSADPGVAGEVLSLMSEVIAGQRWGLGSAGRPARFKGGWGPGTDGRYLVRQVGVLEYAGGDRAVAVALAARTGDGSFAAGTTGLTTLARWAAEHIDPDGARPARC